MVALVILSVIIMGLASTTITFLHETTVDTVRVRAATVADTRIAEARALPSYTALTSLAEVNTVYPELGWTRTTVVTRDSSPASGCNSPPFPACPPNDLTRITVTVTAPGLATPVSRTTAIAAF